jgi:hypothetical protein
LTKWGETHAIDVAQHGGSEKTRPNAQRDENKVQGAMCLLGMNNVFPVIRPQ